LALWFWVVHRELRFRKDTVKSAASQLAACRKKHMQTVGFAKWIAQQMALYCKFLQVKNKNQTDWH